MFVALIIVHIICSIALILIVLLQAGKGAGISNVFGGAGQTVFGARTGDVLARATEICAGLFMVTSLGLAMVSSDRSSSVMRRHSMPMSQPGTPFSPEQQAAMEKMKQAFAGIANTVKQAATTATKPAPAAEPKSTTSEQTAAAVTQTVATAVPAETTTPASAPAMTPAPPVSAAVPSAPSGDAPAQTQAPSK